MDEDATGRAPDAERRAWARETFGHLGALPGEQLQALRLVYRDGLLLAEAAAEVGISISEFARHVEAGLRAVGEAAVPMAG